MIVIFALMANGHDGNRASILDLEERNVTGVAERYQ